MTTGLAAESASYCTITAPRRVGPAIEADSKVIVGSRMQWRAKGRGGGGGGLMRRVADQRRLPGIIVGAGHPYQ